MSLDFKIIEDKWQRRWSEARVFEADPDPKKPKYYLTVAYPYPNSPQHIGHARTYTLADAHARYMRMKGYNTLLPMAFHYTGTPILAMSKRVAAKDPELIDVFMHLYGVDASSIDSFKDPLNIARYFHRDIKLGMQAMGFSIDWRREFTTIDPAYTKFIEWQFRRLLSAGLITKGAHPVGWCPSCMSAVGQHDTKGDLEPEVVEFTAIKFRLGNLSLPVATLRPETVFGVTNIWINPDAKYVEVEVDGEHMIVSERALQKLKGLMPKIERVRDLAGMELVGRHATNPVTGSEVPVLPAEFVDPNNATGVVMSVPAHAPYDLLALRDLKSNADAIRSYGLDQREIAALEPIPVVGLEGYSTVPAEDVVKRLGVKDQRDPKGEIATKELYQKEFHLARMLPATGDYAGMPVSKAKERIKQDLVSSKRAFPFYEIINGPIQCRCGAEVTVNLVEDQWFINYADESWKEKVRKHLKKMSLVPDDLRQEFENVVEWLKEKACARRAGLGTRLPWDKEWVIESLSDSTIYMAFYTISRVINERNVEPSALTDEVFDYVFFGKGDPSALPIERGVLEEMRSEFNYFYPLDSRHSGRDLVPNHLTFFIFNHVAIFPEQHWPRQIAVNGSVLMDGKKMSKSLGNIIPLHKAIKIYGADTLRTSILSASELLQDADFSDSQAKSIRSKLLEFYDLSCSYADAGVPDLANADHLDKWIISRVQRVVSQVDSSMQCLRMREAIHCAFYILQQDLQWYMRRRADRCSDPKTRSIIKYVLEAIVKLMAPFAPHICEEIWERFGREGFVSVASYPSADQSLVFEKDEIAEDLLKSLVCDTAEIIRVTGISPARICYYTSPKWKWDVYLKALSALDSGADPKSLIRELMKDAEVRKRGGEAAKFINAISSCVITLPKDDRKKILRNPGIDENAFIGECAGFLSEYFKCKVEVQSADSPIYDPKGKAGQAAPLRPAIYVE
ncbi:MAG: leucine--tRNA ligase [Candidatus Methanosuratincola sp.]|jgi:leucyl-tRNA synthetase|nr:leucine--tRNA ligase [Candidatus Methanosuratincola sp.]